MRFFWIILIIVSFGINTSKDLFQHSHANNIALNLSESDSDKESDNGEEKNEISEKNNEKVLLSKFDITINISQSEENTILLYCDIYSSKPIHFGFSVFSPPEAIV